MFSLELVLNTTYPIALPNNAGTFVIYFKGITASSGGVVTPQVSIDGGQTYFDVPVYSISGADMVNTISADGPYSVTAAGFTNLRLLVTNAGTGIAEFSYNISASFSGISLGASGGGGGGGGDVTIAGQAAPIEVKSSGFFEGNIAFTLSGYYASNAILANPFTINVGSTLQETIEILSTYVFTSIGTLDFDGHINNVLSSTEEIGTKGSGVSLTPEIYTENDFLFQFSSAGYYTNIENNQPAYLASNQYLHSNVSTARTAQVMTTNSEGNIFFTPVLSSQTSGTFGSCGVGVKIKGRIY
jgi:hypothetical protein